MIVFLRNISRIKWFFDKKIIRGEKKISFLEIYLEDDVAGGAKELRMMSCEQICGRHLHLEDNRKNLTEKIQILQSNSPHCHIFHGKNTFKVRSINATDITTSSCGHNPWYLIRAIKSSRKQLNILFLNTIVWGVEIGQGIKLQRSGEEIGQEKIAELIMHKINSIFDEPTQWEEIQVFH